MSERVVFLEGGEDLDVEAEYRRLVEASTIEECEIALPRGYMSVTQINMYRTCGKQFYFRYVKGLISPPSIALVEGRAVHQGIATGYLEASKDKNRKVEVDVMLDAAHDAWNRGKKELDPHDPANRDEDPEEVVLKRCRVFLEKYNQSYMTQLCAHVDDTGPVVERRFFVTVGELKIPVMGYIDLVADTVDPEKVAETIVIDHKVVGRARTEEDARGDLQLTVYSAVTGVPLVGFHSFVKNKVPIIREVRSSRTSADRKWMKYVIQEVAQAIAKGVFPPTASGWKCSPTYCGYWQMCHTCRE